MKYVYTNKKIKKNNFYINYHKININTINV
jgi:hypothetical protein